MTDDQEQLPPGAERIGPLLFVPLEEPPGDEFKRIQQTTPPRFWMEEQTGALADAVEAYMNGERIEGQTLEVLKLYLRQYVERAILTGDAQRGKLLTQVEKLRTTGDIERLADELSEFGAEPF